MKGNQSSGISREELLKLQKGEVVKYERGLYLVVSEVDVERGVITGHILGDVYGVNCQPISYLEQSATNIAKWKNPNSEREVRFNTSTD